MDREGRVVGGEVGIGKCSGELGGLEVAVVDLDRVTRAEVGSEDVAGGGGVDDRETRVRRACGTVVDDDLRDRVRGAEFAVPSGDGAVEGREEEGGLGSVGQNHSGGSGSRDGAGGQSCGGGETGGRRDDDLKRDGSGGWDDVVEAGSLGADPPGGTGRDGPRIDEVCIGGDGWDGAVGDDVFYTVRAGGLGDCRDGCETTKDDRS